MPFFRDLSKPQPLEFHAEMLLAVQRPHTGSLQRRHTMKEAKDMKNRLGIFRRRNESPGANPSGKLDKVLKSLKPTPEEALKWGDSLEKLLLHKYGLAAFRAFLRTEFSEENLEFWLACEEFKKIKSQSKMVSKAKKIFSEYIAIQSCKEVRAGSQAGVWLPARSLPGEPLTSPGSSAHRSTWTPTHGSTPRRTCRTSPAAALTWHRRGFMGSWRRTRTLASSAPTCTWT
uniref:Regulator of G protein signaling 3 n=1 Tax=Cyanoderma ruficeps TaxID=181631 RepID=A0A8C3QZ38_9PASS